MPRDEGLTISDAHSNFARGIVLHPQVSDDGRSVRNLASNASGICGSSVRALDARRATAGAATGKDYYCINATHGGRDNKIECPTMLGYIIVFR